MQQADNVRDVGGHRHRYLSNSESDEVTQPHIQWIRSHDKVALLHDFPHSARWDKSHERTRYLLYSVRHLSQYTLKPNGIYGNTNVIGPQQLFQCNDRHSMQFPLSRLFLGNDRCWISSLNNWSSADSGKTKPNYQIGPQRPLKVGWWPFLNSPGCEINTCHQPNADTFYTLVDIYAHLPAAVAHNM